MGGNTEIKFFQYGLQVLRMYSLILGIFWLIPGVFFNLGQVVINKSSRVSQGLAKKRFKLIPGDSNEIVPFQLLYQLLLVEVDVIPRKKNCKRNSIQTGDSNSSKIVFTLLTKVIILYDSSITINVKELGLQFIFKK